MLMTALANRYAHPLLDARQKSELMPSLASRYPITVEDAYEIAERIGDIRTAEGETIVGRKFDYLNGISPVDHRKAQLPFWGWLYDSSVRFMENSEGSFSLKGMLQPRIEAEVVFRLGKVPPENATIREMADCIEWMAHGIEVTEYPFVDSPRNLVDAVAGFGMHGALLVGEPKIVSEGSRKSLADVLECASMSLACGEVIQTAGFGSDTFSNPLTGLLKLHQMLGLQARFPSLQAGDIIASGSWTRPVDARPGNVWLTAISGLPLPGLVVEFTQ